MASVVHLRNGLGKVLDSARVSMGPNFDLSIENCLRGHWRIYWRELTKFSSSSGKTARRREWQLCRLHSAHLVHLFLGATKKPVRRYPLTWAEANDLASQVNPRFATGEAVRIVPVRKADGSVRPTLDFGPIARASQSFADHLIQARVEPSPFEFARKGRGREAAAAHGLHAIKHKGVRAFGLADVKGYFPSITREHVYAVLPISRRIIDKTIFLPKETHIILNDPSFHTFENAVRAGLLQGSRPSAIVASQVLVGPLSTSKSRFVESYSDNLMLGDRTMEDVQVKLNALASSLEKHPHGPLLLKDRMVVDLGQPMNFLGYRFRRRPRAYGGFGRISPSFEAIHRMQVRLGTRLLLLSDAHWEKEIDDVTLNWSMSFTKWDGREEGAVIAAIVFCDDVQPRLWGAQKQLKSAKFKTFAEWKQEAAKLARAAIPHPFIGYTVNPTGSPLH